MKIKMLITVPRTDLGMMSDLRRGETYNLDDEIADKLIADGKADLVID